MKTNTIHIAQKILYVIMFLLLLCIGQKLDAQITATATKTQTIAHGSGDIPITFTYADFGIVDEVECFTWEVTTSGVQKDANGDLSYTAVGAVTSISGNGNNCNNNSVVFTDEPLFHNFEETCFNATSEYTIIVDRPNVVTSACADLDIVITMKITYLATQKYEAPQSENITRNRNADANCEFNNDNYIKNQIRNNINTTDNCITITNDDITLNSSGPYAITCGGDPHEIEFTITDDCGNTSDTYTFFLNVNDLSGANGEPELTIINSEETLPVDDNCEITFETILDSLVSKNSFSVTDNCNIVDTTVTSATTGGIELMITDGECLHSGFVVVTVTDECGNTSTDQINIILEDQSGPNLENVPATALMIDAGLAADCEITVESVFDSLISAGFDLTDNCGNVLTEDDLEFKESQNSRLKSAFYAPGDIVLGDDVLLLQSINPNMPFPGEFTFPMSCDGISTKVYITATDDCGNVSIDSFDVKVFDNTAPMVTINNPITIWTNATQYVCELDSSQVVNKLRNNTTASDICADVLTYYIDYNGPYTADCPNNTHMITYYVEDTCDNVWSETLEVTIEHQAPSIMKLADLILDVDASCLITEAEILDSLVQAGAFTTNFHCSLADTVITFNTLNQIETESCSSSGLVTMTVTDECGKTGEMSFNITLEDNSGPTFSNLPTTPIEIDAGGIKGMIVTGFAAGSGAYEDCGLTLDSVFNYLINDSGFILSDACGNVLNDNYDCLDCGEFDKTLKSSSEPGDDPVLGQDVIFYQSINPNIEFPQGYTFPVSCDGVTTTVYINATDDCGNATTESFDVKVFDDTAPTVTIDNPLSIWDTDMNCSLDSMTILDKLIFNTVAHDNCTVEQELSYWIDYNGPYTAECPNNVHMITYYVSDTCDNVWSETLEVTINHAAPSIEMPSSGLTLDVDASCDITAEAILDSIVQEGLLVTNFSCSLTDTTLTMNTLDPANLGNGTCSTQDDVTIMVTDDCGKTATMNFTITLEDKTGPAMTGNPGSLMIDIGQVHNCLVTGQSIHDSLFINYGLTISDACDNQHGGYNLGNRFGLSYDDGTGNMVDINDDSTPLPFTCAGLTTRVYIDVKDRCDNHVIDYIDVTIEDSSPPEVDIDTEITMEIATGCNIGSAEMVLRFEDILDLNQPAFGSDQTKTLKNGNSLSQYANDNCTEDYELTVSIDEAGPFSAECNMNVHMITLNVADTCGNTWTDIIEVTIEQDNPGPTLDVVRPNFGPIGTMLMDPPFPLNSSNNGSSNPNHLYGDSPGQGSIYHNGLGNPIYKFSSNPNDTMPHVALSVDASCELTIEGIKQQLLTLPNFVLEDGCSDYQTLVDNMSIVIRENDIRYDLDGLSSVDLTNLTCNERFGIVVETFDDCGNTKTVGFNVRVIENTVPTISGPDRITIEADGSDCGPISYEDLVVEIINTGLITVNNVCDPEDIIMALWMDNPNTPEDENGGGRDFYGNPRWPNPGQVTTEYIPECPVNYQADTIYIQIVPACRGFLGFVQGNISNVLAINVRYLDNTAPVIAYNDSELTNDGTLTEEANSGNCSRSINLTSLMDIDYLCNPDPSSLSFSSTGVTITNGVGDFSVGSHDVSVTATDVCGNSSDDIFTVIIVDDDDPIMDCSVLYGSLKDYIGFTIPSDISTSNEFSITTDPGNCHATVQFTLPTLTDECGIASVAIEYYDISGSSSNMIGADPTGDVAGNSNHSYDLPTGENKVVITVTDNNGNETVCEFFVTVTDNEPPVANCGSGVTIYLDAISGEAAISASAITMAGSSDNCGIYSVTSTPAVFTCDDVGNNTLIASIIVTDEAGHSDACNVVVTVIDDTAPTLSFANNDPNGASVLLDCGDTYTEIFPIIEDNCSVTGSVSFNGSVDTNTPGIYYIHYEASDDSGNPAPTLIRVIEVGDPLDFGDITISGPSNACAGSTGYTFSFPETVPNGVGIVWSYAGTGGAVSAGQGTNSANFDFANGTTSGDVVVTLSSGCGFETFTYPVTIDAPIPMCQDFTAMLDPNIGFVTISPNDVDGGSTSVCGIVSLSVSPNTFSCQQLGENEVVLTVTDLAGISSTCTATVTVEDITGSIGPISGPVDVCPESGGHVYSIPTLPAGATVSWDAGDGTIIGSNDTESISVDFPAANGSSGTTITATINSGCGNNDIELEVNYLDAQTCSALNCIANLHVDSGMFSPNGTHHYEVDMYITSDALIEDGMDVTFQSGNYIELEEGFEVEANAEFEANIATCTTSNLSTEQLDILEKALREKGINLDKVKSSDED